MKTKFYLNYLRYLKQLLVLCLFLLPVTEGFSQTANMDLRVTGPGEAEPGDELSYTISYSNIGAVLTNNVVIELTLPSGNFVYSGSSPAGVESGGKIIWTKDDIPQLEQLNTGIYSITVNLIAGNPETLTNSSGQDVVAYSISNDTETLTLSATIQSDEVIVPVESNVVTTEISRRCTFSISNSAGVKSSANSTLTYLLALVNTGNVYERYSLTSNLIEGQDLIRQILPMDSNTSELSVTPYIAPGEIFFFRYHLQPPGETKPDEYPYTSITATPETCGAVVATFISGGQYDDFEPVGVYKIDTPDPVPAGSSLSCKIVILNAGEALANVYLTETYPLNTSFVSANPPASYFNNQWHFPLLPPGNTIIDVVLNVQNNIANGTELTNTVAISDGSQTYSIFQEKTTVASAPDLIITKTANKTVVLPGEEVEYTIAYQNTGNRTAIGVTITDDYNETYMTVINAGGGTDSEPAGLLTWNLPDLAPGTSGTITYTLQVDNNISNFPVGSTNILNIAAIDVDPTRPDADLNNNQSYAVVTVQNVPDLVVDIVSDADPVEPEAAYTYTITVSNIGKVDHTGHSYTVIAYLPETATYLSNGTGGIYSTVDHTVTWTVDTDLPVGGSELFTVTMQAPGCAEVNSTLAITATAYSDYWVDANPDDNEATLNLNVEDKTAPVITLPDVANPFPVECNQSQSGTYDLFIQSLIAQVEVSDNCDIEPALNHDYLGFVQSCAEDLVITFTAIDASGNEAIPQTLTISFIDDTAPAFTNVPEPLELVCNQSADYSGMISAWLASAEASDACDENVEITNDYTAYSQGCGQVITVTFTATDDCNNSVTATSTISFIDDTAPAFTNVPGPLELVCSQSADYSGMISAWLASAEASDACDENVEITNDYTAYSQGCGQVITVTFTATDDCNNSVTATSTISFIDDTAPAFTNVPGPLELVCSQSADYSGMISAWLASAEASDACDENVEITNDYTAYSQGCGQVITVTFTATDDCNNSVTATSTISFIDDTAPAFANVPGPLELVCSQSADYSGMISAWLASAEASDACDENVEITNDYTAYSQGCGQVITVTFTATDDCNNSVTATSTISFIDDTAPAFTNVPGPLELVCSQSADYSGMISAWLASAEASDACDENVEITNDYTAYSQGCGQVITVTFTATDDCNNSVTATSTISFIDDTAPAFANVPGPLELVCSQSADYSGMISAWLASAEASDACDENVEITNDYTAYSQGCGQVITVTFTATDDCNNSVTATSTISFIDDTAPAFANVPGPLELVCSQSADYSGMISAWLASAEASDACDENVEITNDYTAYSQGCGQVITVTFTATDDCNNSVTATSTISFIDDTAPAFANVPGPLELVCSQSADYSGMISAWLASAEASDACDENVEITNDYTAYSQGCGQVITVTFTATDDCNNSVTATSTISFIDDTAPAFANVPGPLELVCSQSADYSGMISAWLASAEASDACDENVEITNDYTAYSQGCGQVITVTFTATDDCNNSVTATSTISFIDDTAPAFANVPGPLELVCSQSADYSGMISAWLASAEASDACDENVEITNDYTAYSQGCGQVITVTFTATDDCNNSVTATSTISFIDDTAPAFANVPGPLELVCNQSADYSGMISAWLASAEASDACDENVEITNDYTAYSQGCGQVITVTFTATDDCNNSVTATSTISFIDDTAPAFANVPGPLELVCSQSADYSGMISAWLASAEASDACDENVEITNDYTAYSQGCGQVITVTFTATDDCNNSVTATSTISFIDDTAPAFANVPGPLELVCSQSADYSGMISAWLASAEASDACDENVEITNDYTAYSQGCGQVITVTFTATDDCNNSVTATSTISFIDDTAPAFANVPGPLELVCSQSADYSGMISAWLASAEASDACDENVEITNDYTAYSQGCGQVITVTFTATDDCNNSVTATSTISFIDDTAPAFANVPGPLELVCSQSADYSGMISAWLASAEASDACDENVEITNDYTAYSQGCGQVITVTFTATDDCNNSVTATSTISFIDDTAPVLTAPAPLVLECEPGTDYRTIIEDWLASATAEENCDTELAIDNNYGIDTQRCGEEIAVTFTATDACGNAAMPVTSTITFIDNMAPVITAPLPLVLTCNQSADHEAAIVNWLAEASVSDNCDSYIVVGNNYSAYTQSCNHEVVVIFTASDICGNEAESVSSTITFIDHTAPTITFCPPDLTIEGDESSDPADTGMATAEDDCDTVPAVTYVDQIIDGPNAVEFTIKRIWTATDDCGNSSTCVQVIDVVDTTPPVIVCPVHPSAIVVDWDLCQASGFNLGTPIVSDNLSLPGDIQVYNDAPESLPVGTTVITWTAVDEAGNTATCTQEIIVPDIYNVEVSTGFSPNGDGINDYFRIHGMCLYPDARIEIFSRWGAKVYEKDRYGNTDIHGNTDAWWDGRANVNGKGKDILPAGTYFYVLKLSNSEVRKGAVYINR